MTVLSMKGVTEPLKKMDLVVVGIFGIIYLCLGWAESSVRRFWSPFFRVDLSPTMFRCAVLFIGLIGLLLCICCCTAFYFIICCWPVGIPIYLLYCYPEISHVLWLSIFVGSCYGCLFNTIFVAIPIVGWLFKRFIGL